MKQPKKPITYRLSEETIREINAIATRNKVTPSEVISALVHCYTAGWDIDQVEETLAILAKN